MTSQQHERGNEDPRFDEAAVAEFLRRNPEFFLRHRSVLEEIRIPHDVAPAVSLIEYQVEVLREEKRRVRWRLDDLLRVARDNDRLSEQLHRLTLELFLADGLDAVLVTLYEDLQNSFRADVVQITLVGDDLPAVNARLLSPADGEAARLGERFPGRRAVVGRLHREHLQAAFGEQAGRVRSAAVVPLDEAPVRGLVAIGSGDPERYRGDQGTVFLSRLGDLVARALRVHLEGRPKTSR